MRVKICGIRSLDEANGVIEAGADALGFHIELEHSRCPLATETASGIISKLPPFISTVVVTSETDPKKFAHHEIHGSNYLAAPQGSVAENRECSQDSFPQYEDIRRYFGNQRRIYCYCEKL